ncbi:hypothetical protein Avbf_18435 [Armadillidium vulgare]|nr:hypothetical protein Avbf_18435 [Armadillidium vulgare]
MSYWFLEKIGVARRGSEAHTRNVTQFRLVASVVSAKLVPFDYKFAFCVAAFIIPNFFSSFIKMNQAPSPSTISPSGTSKKDDHIKRPMNAFMNAEKKNCTGKSENA